MNILRQRTNNVEVKKYCIDTLHKLGSFAYTKQVKTMNQPTLDFKVKDCLFISATRA